MPEEQENPIERRDSAGGIGRRSDIARRGMNAANYVSGLAARQETTGTEYTYEFLRKWGSRGREDGRFHDPYGIAIDREGNVYVSDNHRIQVFNPGGQFLCKWGSEGEGDGEFAYPGGIEIDGEGKVYVADTYNNRIQVFGPEGRFLYKWGIYGDGDGVRSFSFPSGMALGGDGEVYVTDRNNDRIQVFKRVLVNS